MRNTVIILLTMATVFFAQAKQSGVRSETGKVVRQTLNSTMVKNRQALQEMRNMNNPFANFVFAIFGVKDVFSQGDATIIGLAIQNVVNWGAQAKENYQVLTGKIKMGLDIGLSSATALKTALTSMVGLGKEAEVDRLAEEIGLNCRP